MKLTPKSPSGEALVKIFLPEEVRHHEAYRFPSAEVCEVGGVMVQASKCTVRECKRKHFTLVPMHAVGCGAWDLRSLCIPEGSEATAEATERSQVAPNVARGR